MTTPLGRDVALGDWNAYRSDQVLELLYEFQQNPFNDGSLHYSLASICNATRQDPKSAREVAASLVARGLATEPVPQSYRITSRGMQFVRAVRSNPLIDFA